MSPEERLEELEDALDELIEEVEVFEDCTYSRAFGEVTLVVPRDKLYAVMKTLRENITVAFEQCIDVCGVDYSAYGDSEWDADGAPETGFGRATVKVKDKEIASHDRYAVVYHLLSVTLNHRLRVKVMLDAEYPLVDSVRDIWTGVEWFEREAFDMYGIMFAGHPDLRRILTDYGFVGHPFRKDFPLVGHVEMRYDEAAGRVVYESVSIEQRTQVPRIVREDNRYESGWKPEPVAAEEEGEADA